jgi:hypothetical protein
MDEQSARAREGSREDTYDVGEAFGAHTIEYWVYDGTRLIPASPDEQEQLREWEQRSRLAQWTAGERRGRVRARRRPWFFARQGLLLCVAWLRGGRGESVALARGASSPHQGHVQQPEQPNRRVINVKRQPATGKDRPHGPCADRRG